MIFIDGKKVYLRKVLLSDITSKYIGWLNDPSVMMYSRHYGKVHTPYSCKDYLESFQGTGNYFLAIFEKVSSKQIGTLTIYFSDSHTKADIGIMIGDQEFRGRGYAKDAIESVVNYLRSISPELTMTCGTRVENIQMINLALSCGFFKESEAIVNGITYVYFTI